MLRTTSRGMAIVFCLALLLVCLTGPAWDPSSAYAGSGTGGPPPPADSNGNGDSYEPPGGESPMEVNSSMSQQILYWYLLATLIY